MEEIINKWNVELEEDIASFNQLAKNVSDWDRILISNADKIMGLHSMIQEVESSQKDLDDNLALLEGQQTDLDGMLTDIDRMLSQHSPVEQTSLAPADQERLKAFETAEVINKQLDGMSNTLQKTVAKLNDAYEKTDPKNQVSQIVQILNAHLNSLQWIEQKTSSLHGLISEASKEMNKQEYDMARL